MKKLVLAATLFTVMFGCTARPVVMKTDKRYFSPVRTTAQAKTPAALQTTKVVTLLNAEKEIAAKNVTIDLLKKENQRLRERIVRLEKKLAITNS
jgi:TolA-binding protein